jgi:hypothetical protein
MAMRSSLVSSAYHRKAPLSGDIPISHDSTSHDGQLHMSDPVSLAGDRLPVEEVGDAVVAQASEATTGDDISAPTPTDLADVPPPATAVTHPVALFANNRAVSHFSLSALRKQAAGK